LSPPDAPDGQGDLGSGSGGTSDEVELQEISSDVKAENEEWMRLLGLTLSQDDKYYFVGAALLLALLICCVFALCCYRKTSKEGTRTASNDGPKLTLGNGDRERAESESPQRRGCPKPVRRRSSVGIGIGSGQSPGSGKEAARLSASNGRAPHGVTSTKLDGNFFDVFNPLRASRASRADDDSVAYVRESEVVSERSSGEEKADTEPVRPTLGRTNTSHGIEVSPCGAGICLRASSVDSDDGGTGSAPQLQQREWLQRQASRGGALPAEQRSQERSQDRRSLKSVRLDSGFFEDEGGEGGGGAIGDSPRGACRVSMSEAEPPCVFSGADDAPAPAPPPPLTTSASSSCVLTERSRPRGFSGSTLSDKLRRGKNPSARHQGAAETSRSGPMQAVSLDGSFFESSRRGSTAAPASPAENSESRGSRRGSTESRRRSMDNLCDFAGPAEQPASLPPGRSAAVLREHAGGPTGGPLARRASQKNLKSRHDSTSSVGSTENSVAEGLEATKKGSKGRVTFDRAQGSSSQRGSLEQGTGGSSMPSLLRKSSSSQGLSPREDGSASRRSSLMSSRKGSSRDLFSGGQMPDGTSTPRRSSTPGCDDLVERNTQGRGVSADL